MWKWNIKCWSPTSAYWAHVPLPEERGRLGQDSSQFRSHTTARPQGSSVVEPRAEGWSQGVEGAHPQDRATQPDVLGTLYS